MITHVIAIAIVNIILRQGTSAIADLTGTLLFILAFNYSFYKYINNC